MNAKLKQLIMIGIFAGLVGSVFLFRAQMTGFGSTDPDRLTPQQSMDRYGFCMEEVAKQCNLNFTHEAPVLDAKLDHIMPIAAAMGASVAVGDFDRDGWADLYVVNSAASSHNRLYRNKGDGTFEDVAAAMGVADLNRPGEGACMGAVWGDYDNDGFEDLLVYRWGRQDLFHNDAGKKFTRVTEQAALPGWMNANSAIWFDYDRDGWLDIFIAGYWADDIDLWKLTTTKIMPESFEYANNGGHNYLLHNKGNGTFEDVTVAMGIESTRWTLSVAAADLRGTGYPDLFLANDYGINEYYLNQQGKKFIEMGKQTGIGDRPKSGMSVSFGDVYNQARFAIYTSNITEPGVLIQGNNLWVASQEPTGSMLHYTNHAGSLGVEMGRWSWGAQFGDLNNDGKIDLFLTNGYVSANRDENYWYDYSRIAGASKHIISDAANWPAMKGRSLAGYQQKNLWLNRGGKFIDIAAAAGVTDTYDGRAVALVDLWNRGVLDVVLANQAAPLLVYKNNVKKDNQWIQFELEGTKSNRSAIGAQVRLFWDGQVQLQEVSGGNAYASQNQRRLHFGLGQSRTVDRAVITWPSGHTQTITSPKVGMLHKVKEPS